MSKTSLKPALKTPQTIDLDKLDAVQKRNDFAFDADASGKRALAMLQHVEGLRKERAVKAILAGLYLHQVKAALDHGEFEAWIEKHLGKTARTGQNYMKLAAKFARSSRLLLPELVGANQLTLELEAQDSDGRAVLAKLDKFVGSTGLTDLMRKHKVIKQGGKQGAGEDPAGEPAAPPPEGTAEEAEAAARASAFAAIETAEATLLADVLWHDLTPEAAVLVDAKLKALAAAFHDRLLKTQHQAA